VPTASTVPLLLLALLLWRLTRGNLLAITLFLSIFAAASAFNVGDQGIQPWIFILVIGLVLKVATGYSLPSLPAGLNKVAVRLFGVFVLYSLCSGMLCPFLFQGVTARGSHNLVAPGPLSWSMANLAQICYLLAAASLFVIALSTTRDSLRSALDWYVRGCVVVAIFSLYQWANAIAHVPYPSAILYSSPRYAVFHAYQINGIYRLNSTFVEASGMAPYMAAGIVLKGWDVLTQPFCWRSILALALITYALVHTLSTTGYLSLILISLLGMIYAVWSYLRTYTLSPAKVAVLMVAASLGFIALLASDAPQTINKVLHSILIDKDKTSSYAERTEWNQDAMRTAQATYYIGAGWGSVRCSSLAYGLLATVGLIGISLFLAFLLSLMSPLLSRHYKARVGDIYEKSLVAAFVMLAAMVVSGNELDSPILWVAFAAGAMGPAAGQLRNPRLLNRHPPSSIRRLSRSGRLSPGGLETSGQV
jgi:hypothetical protein